ncbi:MAG: hypothetical protein ACRYF7_08065 [Janthinobacterium lividum]
MQLVAALQPAIGLDSVCAAIDGARPAIDESLAGKPLSQAVTKPYGCSVKYG